MLDSVIKKINVGVNNFKFVISEDGELIVGLSNDNIMLVDCNTDKIYDHEIVNNQYIITNIVKYDNVYIVSFYDVSNNTLYLYPISKIKDKYEILNTKYIKFDIDEAIKTTCINSYIYTSANHVIVYDVNAILPIIVNDSLLNISKFKMQELLYNECLYFGISEVNSLNMSMKIIL